MNIPTPRSLRWQIILALFAIVMITIITSWLIAVRLTLRDFETLVRTEALDEAHKYAQLLEAQYNTRGPFDGIADVLIKETGDNVEVAELDKMDPLVTGPVPLEWEEAVAEELGLSLERYRREREDAPPEQIAERHGSSADAIVAAIMTLESQRLIKSGEFDSGDIIFFLFSVLGEVEAYVKGCGKDLWDELEGWEEESTNPLLYDAAILVIDVEGNVLFDGSGGRSNLEIDDPDEEMKMFPIRNWDDGSTVGSVLPDREPGEFGVAELMFLNRTRNGLLTGGLIAAVVALALGTFITQRISRPVLALRDSAIRLARGDAVDRLPVLKGELGAMSAAFNAMADSLAQQQEVRSRMISDLSHELNTPLSVIQLELEALLDGMQPANKAAERVLKEVELLHSLAADLGFLAENEAGLLTIEKETIDLAQFLPATADRWRTQAEAVGIDLRSVVPQANLPVEVDLTRISQALGNLIRNAIQHTPQGGTIEITCARCLVERLGGIWNTICVHDSGVGIAPENLERIFERSVQARENRVGRGLGLTIVRQIVEAHDGHVWAESAVGIGSSFCIALP